VGNSLRLAAVMCGALLFATTWDSDVAADVDTDAASATSITEPITETSVQTTEASAALAPDAEPATRNPLAPYGIGPAAEAIAYEDLAPAQQEAADRGFDTATSSATHNAFAAAVVERSKRARAEAAQHQLGVDSLDTVGVVQ
jgi:hypothetical protein